MKLSKIYSNDKRFKQICFRDGVNVILGQVDNSKEKDEHNLGKTALIYLIDFMLLKEVSQNTYFHRKKDVFSNHTFYLEIETNKSEFVTIKRSFSNITKVSLKFQKNKIICDESTCWDYEDIVINSRSNNKRGAKDILNEKLDYDILTEFNYRKLLGYYIRTQTDYNNVFKLRKYMSSKDDDWKPFVYEMLGFSSDLLRKKYSIFRKKEKLDHKVKAILKYNDHANFGEFKSRIEDLEKRKKILVNDLDSFNFYLNENDISYELVNSIDVKTSKLRKNAYMLQTDLKRIDEAIKKRESTNLDFIVDLFEEVEIYFEEQLRKSYDELIEFNQSLLTDRLKHMSKLRLSKSVELDSINIELLRLSNEREEMFKVLSEEKSIDKYKSLRRNLIEIEKKIQDFRTKTELITASMAELKELKDASQELIDANSAIEKDLNEHNKAYKSIRELYMTYFEKVTTKKAMLEIRLNKASNVEYEIGVLDDKGRMTHKSDGFSYMKMLCIIFDMVLLEYYSDKSFFRFVYHDGPLEALHSNRKEHFLKFLNTYVKDNDVQYIFSSIRGELSDTEFNLISDKIVCTLKETEDGSGTLFGFNY